MASVRILKKEIDWMLSLALYDCFYVMNKTDDKNIKKLEDVASKIVEKHSELRNRANHPDAKGDPKKVKQFYKSIKADLSKTIDETILELEKVIK